MKKALMTWTFKIEPPECGCLGNTSIGIAGTDAADVWIDDDCNPQTNEAEWGRESLAALRILLVRFAMDGLLGTMIVKQEDA